MSVPESGVRHFLQLDNFVVWQHFVAEWEGVALEIKINDRGEPRCIGVSVRDEEGVSSEALRRMPVARLVKEAFAVAASRNEPTEKGGEAIPGIVGTTLRMFVSPGTIKTHLAHIFRKLDVHSRAEQRGR
jgi:hypothetical protein